MHAHAFQDREQTRRRRSAPRRHRRSSRAAWPERSSSPSRARSVPSCAALVGRAEALRGIVEHEQISRPRRPPRSRRDRPAGRTDRPGSRPWASGPAPSRSRSPISGSAASMLKVSASTSTKTGVAPTSATASAVAQKVKVGQNTASPRPMPFAIRIITSASVPLASMTARIWRRRKPPVALEGAAPPAPSGTGNESSTRAIASSIACAEPAALRRHVDERDRVVIDAGVLVHRAVDECSIERHSDQPAARRGPMAAARPSARLAALRGSASRSSRLVDALFAA